MSLASTKALNDIENTNPNLSIFKDGNHGSQILIHFCSKIMQIICEMRTQVSDFQSNVIFLLAMKMDISHQ
jgi:hypothetical protein